MATLLEILMIENNPGDVRLAREMFKDSRLHNNMTIVGDSKQTMACLRKQGEFTQALTPDIIFLNIIMAVKDGFDTWNEILKDAIFCAIPLVLVTVSRGEQDLLKRHNYANNVEPIGYVYKPIDLNQLLITVRQIDGFGLALTKLK